MADNSERTREEDQKAGQSLEQLAKTIESKSFFTVLNPKLNEVVFNYGNFGDLTKTDSPGGNGIVHIIQRRNDKDGLSSVDIASLLLKIKEIAETEPPDSFDKTESRAFINKDGIRVVLQKNWREYEKNWLVSGYGLVDGSGRMTSEATETIQAVTARYGYKPEHSFLREQVGAVIASIPTIRQKQQEVKDLKSRTKIEKGTKIISTSNPKTVYDRATLKSAPRNSSDKELISAYVAMSYARNALENGNKSELFKHTKAKKLLEKSVNETLIKEIEGELRARGYTLHINNSINESSMNYERVVVMDVSAGKEKENSGFGLKKALPPNERQVVEDVKENPIELPENNITQAPESVSNNPAPKTAVLSGKKVYEYEHDGYAARICHGVKDGDYEAKRTMARFLASQIKEPTVLLPCPQHTGEAEYTLEIAEMILEELGPNMVKICNTLVCDPHETMYEQKRTLTEGATRPLSEEQISSLDAGNMRWRENAAQIFGKYIRWKHCLLDNVISTGRTLAEARKLVPDIEPLVFAASKIYLEKNIRKENKLMKKDDMTHGEVVIVRRPHQRPSTVTMFGSFKEALDAYSSDFTLTEYSGIDDYVKNSGFDPENDSEQIEALRKRIRGAGVTEKEPFVEFGIGGYEPEFHLKKDFGEKEALESVVDDDMYSGKVFYAEKGETYGHFAERVYENTRGHNAPDRSKIMSAMSIEPRQLEKLDIRKYFVWNLPEGMAPFSDEQIQELVKWGGEYIDDELYYDPETDEAFRVWSSDDWELDHDERVLNKSGVADILFHAALKVQDDIDFLSVEQEHGENLEKIDGRKKLKDFYMDKYREVRAHEFADLRQVHGFEEDIHGFTSDRAQHQFRFVLNDSNTEALGLKSSNDIYYNLRVQTNIEGHIEDMFLEKRNGDNDLIEGDIALDGDDQCIIFDKARSIVEDYIHTSFPELFPYTVGYAFPETKNYNEIRESIGSVPKEITTYEEPRWNFRDEKELLSVIREADEDLYNEIQDAMKENPDDKFFIDLGKSLRYDDTLLLGKDYSKESLSDKLSNEFDVRYGNEDGSVCNYDDVSTIAIKNEKLAEKLNSMVRNHVDENIRAFEKFKDYRDEAVQEWLGTSGTLSHAMIEVPGEEKKFIVDSEVIPTGIKELLDFPNKTYLGSDRQYHDIEYFISRSYKVRDGKPDLTSGETFLTEKVFVDDGAEGVWEIKEENPLKRYYFGEDTVRLLEDSFDKYTAEKTKQPLVTKSNIERLVRDSIEDNYPLVGKEGGFPEKGTYRLQTGTLPDELVDVLGIKESDRKIVLFGEEHRKEYWLSKAYKIGEDGKIDFSRNPRVRLHAYVDINQNEHTVEDYAVEDLPVPYAEKFDSILNELFDKIASEQSGSPIIEKTPEQEKLELIKDIRNYVTGFENADPDNYSFGEGSFQLQLFCVGKGKDNEYCLEKFLDPDFDTENDAIAFYYNSTDDDAVHDVYWENHVSKSHNSGYISGSNLPEDLKIKFIEECRSTAERFCQNEFDMSVNEVIAANNSGKEIKRNNKHEEKDKNIMEENTSVSLKDFENCDVCIHKVATSDQTKTWQLHVNPQKKGLPTTTVDLKAVEEPELDDLWVGFMYSGKEFDLNIYKDGDGKRKAAVYAVEDGKTNQEKSVSAADFNVIDYDRLKNIFSKVQTDAADGSTMDFEQLCEYIDTEYADERLYYKARKAAGFMIEGFSDFEGVTPDDLEKLGFDASHDDIFDISDEVAEKVLAGELNSVKEIQATVTEMAKAHRKEIVLDKMISGLDYAYDGEPVGKKIRVYADIDPAKFGFSKTNEDKSSGGEYRLCLVLNEDGTINDRELQFVTKEGDVLYDQQVDVLNGEFYNAFWSDNFGDKAVEWFRKRLSMENIFLDIDKHNIREAGEKKGFFTWDEICTLARETGPMDQELKAKDNARAYAGGKAGEFGIDIEGAESPEEAIEDFLKEHPELDRFNEDGQMIEEEKVFERHYDAKEYDIADKDDLMNLGERYGITEEIADEIYRFYNLTADSEDFELLTDPDAKFVVHEFNSDSTWTVSLPELIFEAKERLLIEKAQEEHPWRDTSVTKLVDEDWYYYMAHKELFSDPSKFTADENGEPSPEDIDFAREKYREREIKRIEAQGKHPGINKNVSENTAGRTMEDVRAKEHIEKKNTVQTKYVSENDVGTYLLLKDRQDFSEIRSVFVANGFSEAFLGDDVMESLIDEMRSSWAEEFVEGTGKKVYWHDIEGEKGFEFAEVDRNRCEAVLQNCIDSISAATQGREDQDQFLEPFRKVLEEYKERTREEQLDVAWSEGRMREFFDGMTSSLGSGNQMSFDEMKEWVKGEFPDRDDRAVLQDTVSRMLYDNVDFADFEVTEYDDKYRLGDGGDYRWSLAEDAAKKLIYGEIYTMEQAQEAVTARSYEMKKDLLEKSDDRYMMMTADRIHAAGEIIMSKYEDYPELMSFYETFYTKKANKTLALGELCEEKLKEIAEHYNNGEGLVTMETINDDTETVEITYTPSEIEALIKGRDAYLVGEESLDFIRPNAGQLEIGFREGGYKFDDIARGCAVFTGQEGVENAKCIEQIDSMNVFASDSKAAEQWARDTRGKLLVEGKDIFLSGLNGCVTFIDTTKNREILKDYLLDKPLEQKFDWTGFSEECFDELKKDILSGRLGENYDASVKDYRGTVNIGNIAVDITFREKGRTSLDYDFYILGQKGEGERHGVPYDYESGETFDLIGIRDNDYETFKKFFEKEVTDTIAKREDLLKEAVQPTIDWSDEKAVKDLYSKKLGEQLAKEFATLDFKPDTWNELLEKGADPREALVIAAEDANLGDNLNWLLDRIGDDKLKEYFSDREFAGRVFDAAKESMTHDLSNSLSDIGDREGFRAFPAFYTSAITRLAELTVKTGELLSYGDELLIKEGKAVRVEPYTRDEKAIQAVRNALARMEGYGDENEIGTDKVTAFIDNIGNENNHMVIGLGDAAGYMNWYDKAHNGMEYKIPEILAQIESWAEGHAAVAGADSEQARDYGYIQELRKYHPIQNNEIWKHLEEQFRNVRTFHLDFSGDFSETKKEVLDYYVDSNTDFDEKKWQEDTVYRLLEENINFGTLSETKDELDSPDHSEKMEQRSGILEKLSERIVAGEITVEQAQGEADKLIYGFKFDWTEFSQDDFRKLKEDIERGKVIEGKNYGSVHIGSISIDLAWRDNPEGGSLLDIDFYTLGEKGIGGQIELDDGTEIPYDEYFAGQIGFDSVEKMSYEEFKKAYEDVLEDLLIHGEDKEHYIREAQRPLVDWGNEEQVRVLMDEKLKESKSLSFSDDLDKMRDFDSLTKEEFLDSYSYITEQMYDATARELSLKGVSGKEQAREIESGIASKVLQNVREHWNWGGNAVFDEARAWNPEEYGIESEDDHKVHVLVQFHDNHGKGSCPSEEDFSDKVNNHWLIQDLHADGVEVIGLNTEISGTIDQYLSKLKENLKNGISFSYIGIDSEKTSELETIISEKPVVGFKLFLEEKSDLRKLFENTDSGQKLMPGDEVSILANYDTEGLESLSAILVTWNGNGDSVNLLATNLLDDKDKIRIKDVVNNEINLYLERNKEGMSVREAYFTEPKPVKVFRNGQDLADFMNETNRERKDPDIYDEQAEAILYLLTEAQSSVYADEKGNGYLLDLSENFDGMGARASNKDIVELALESADKIKVCDTESKRLIRELYEEFEKNQEKNPIELADEIAAEKEKEIVPELFKKELLSLMRSEKLTVKDPFIATKVILDVWKKEKPQSVQYLNEYLKRNGCTSKEGFEKFFKDEVGLRKKEPAHEFHLKKAALKRESDGREGR